MHSQIVFTEYKLQECGQEDQLDNVIDMDTVGMTYDVPEKSGKPRRI